MCFYPIIYVLDCLGTTLCLFRCHCPSAPSTSENARPALIHAYWFVWFCLYTDCSPISHAHAYSSEQTVHCTHGRHHYLSAQWLTKGSQYDFVTGRGDKLSANRFRELMKGIGSDREALIKKVWEQCLKCCSAKDTNAYSFACRIFSLSHFVYT